MKKIVAGLVVVLGFCACAHRTSGTLDVNKALDYCAEQTQRSLVELKGDSGPRAWEAMFEEVKQDNFGLEWEPTHQMVQLIDPVSQLRKWCHKIVHVHGKDATIDWNAVRHGGISGAETFVWHRMPGFGNTNWSDIISILRANGYEDDICIEGYHDPVYSGEWEMTGQLHALRYLKWCRGGDYEPVPWEV